MLSSADIVIKTIPETRVVSRRTHLKNRADLPGLLRELQQGIPSQHVTGPPFCILQFISSLTEGYDAELCFPVSQECQAGLDRTRITPEMEVLSLTHRGEAQDLGESYRKLYAWAAGRGIISDEFCREVYPDPETAGQGEIEIQFVVHPWESLLTRHLQEILGEEKALLVAPGREELDLTSPLEERFLWVRGAVEKMESLFGDRECYQVLSRCAHVFPPRQISKLREVYLEAEGRTGNTLAAVDAVIDFMGEDPGWGQRPQRDGFTVLSSKKPRDPEGYQQAVTPEEKKRAYCFCPLLRQHLQEDMPPCFCYCGAGWYRQQWEGALGQPVKIRITRSLLRGDDRCEFAIELPVSDPPQQTQP